MDIDNTSRIGIFGGSFDPPHEAHLEMARMARDKFSLDKIIFVPCNQNPLKDITGHASPFHRYVMTQLATLVEDQLVVSPLEINRGGKSFMIDTLEAFSRTGCKLFMIIGLDSFRTLGEWKDSVRFPDLCEVIVFSRHDEIPELDIPEKLREKSHFFSGFKMDISSTDIRKKIRTGENVDKSLSPMVKVYIKKYELYLNFRDQNRLIDDPIKEYFIKG